jgi:hypothetical protein
MYISYFTAYNTRNKEVHYRGHNTTYLIFSQLYPVHKSTDLLFQINFNIIYLPILNTATRLSFLVLLIKNCTVFSHLHHACYIPNHLTSLTLIIIIIIIIVGD